MAASAEIKEHLAGYLSGADVTQYYAASLRD